MKVVYILIETQYSLHVFYFLNKTEKVFFFATSLLYHKALEKCRKHSCSEMPVVFYQCKTILVFFN